MDQAVTLRRLMEESSTWKGPVVGVCAASPDSGKNPFLSALSGALAHSGHRVLVIDFDAFLLCPYSIHDLLEKRLEPMDFLQQKNDGLWVLPLTQSYDELHELSREDLERVIQSFEAYSWFFDLVLINFMPGPCLAAFRNLPLVLVVGDSTDSVETASTWIQDLTQQEPKCQVAIGFMDAADAKRARDAYLSIETSAARWGQFDFYYLGYLPVQEKSLLEWSENAMSGLLAKRFREWSELGEVEGSALRSLGSRGPILIKRDWSAGLGSGSGPGLQEGFWKKFLREVNHERD